MTDEDDLSIPDFLKRKPGEPRPVIEHEYVPPPEKFFKAPEPKPVVEKKERQAPNIDIQAATREKFALIIGEIEGMIDDSVLNAEFDFYRFLLKKEYPPRLASEVVNHFTPRLDEIKAVIAKSDASLTEGYKLYSKAELTAIELMFERIIEDSQRYASNVKSLRKLNKKKPIKVEKLVKGLPFAKAYEKYNLVSVDPTTIIEAQELWTFNFAQNILTVYRALDKKGLTLKGSTVINVDEKATIAKRIGRNTEERLKVVLSGGKVALRKLMDEINGDPQPVTRITKQTILLRVISS